MSGLLIGLSIFLLLITIPSPGYAAAGTGSKTGAAALVEPTLTPGDEAEAKPDINEIIKTATVFTNSVGMVLKKVGSLWVAVNETTQQEYEEVMDSNPSTFRGDQHPVDSISWNTANAFCAKLTEHEKAEEMLPEGYVYELPTQAQWQALASGTPLTSAVTSSTTRRSGTAKVRSLPASNNGLYDLRGNVAEWCADPPEGAFRVLRGGSWADWIEVNLRPDFRAYAAPDESKNTYGFRCVLIPAASKR